MILACTSFGGLRIKIHLFAEEFCYELHNFMKWFKRITKEMTQTRTLWRVVLVKNNNLSQIAQLMRNKEMKHIPFVVLFLCGWQIFCRNFNAYYKYKCMYVCINRYDIQFSTVGLGFSSNSNSSSGISSMAILFFGFGFSVSLTILGTLICSRPLL